jgi:hypothetical protein
MPTHRGTGLRPVALLALFALPALAGCERGCLTDWLARRGVGEDAATGRGSLPLNAVDCSDGVARCVDGVVQASRAFSYSVPCSGPPDRCRCPWDNLSACDRGCVAEGVEVAIARDPAPVQLCAPEAADVFARPPPGAPLEMPPGWCEGELFRCSGGVVIGCEGADAGPSAPGAPGALATCLFGCAEPDMVLDDAPVTRDAAVAILCAHRPPPR